MSLTLALVLAAVFLPLAFLFGGVMVKFGAYVAGVKMPGLLKACLLGLAAQLVSGWVTPVVLNFTPTGDYLVPTVVLSMVTTVLVGGLVFKVTMGLSYAKGLVVSLVHRSIGLAGATVGLLVYLFAA